jgi:hypothetical protein
MTYCNEVSKLTTLTYEGIAKRTSFDSATSTDFDIIFYNNDTGLRYFMVYALMGGIAEAIFSDCRIRIYDYAIAYFTTIIKSNIGIYYTVITNLHTFSDVYAGIYYTTVTDPYVIGYCYKIMNVAVCTNFCTVGN